MDQNIDNQSNKLQYPFIIKFIGKSFVGKTLFIKNSINKSENYNYKKTNNYTISLLNYQYQYKKESFYLEEEPEISISDLFSIQGKLLLSSYMEKCKKYKYAAFVFIFDITDKDSFLYIKHLLEKIYLNDYFYKSAKIVINNINNSINSQFNQVNENEIQNFIKKNNLKYFEMSCSDPEKIKQILDEIYLAQKDCFYLLRHEFMSKNDNTYFIEKEKLIPNYYEICIIGSSGSGKDCLKNKFLYDEAEKNVDMIEYHAPRIINFNNKEIKYDVYSPKPLKNSDNNIDESFYYTKIMSLDENCTCVLLTYDISKNESMDELQKIISQVLEDPFRYRRCYNILGMKCDLLRENEFQEKIIKGKKLAEILGAHFYLVSTRTGYNVNNVFNDILVQSYNKYHPNDLLNIACNESNIDDKDLYNNIHIRLDKPKLTKKEKKKDEKQYEKEIAVINKLKKQKEEKIILKNKKISENYVNNIKETIKQNLSKIIRCDQCYKIPKISINDLTKDVKTTCIHKGKKATKLQKISEYVINTQNIICNFCKSNNSNHPYSMDYCFKCQKIFCKKCEKSHENFIGCEKNNKIVCPLYLMDLYCEPIENPSSPELYCIDCGKNYLNESNEHINHNNFYYDNGIINNLIFEKKRLLEKEKEIFKYVQVAFEDSIKSLQKKFKELMEIKYKTLILKENIINNLEIIKKNYNLIQSVSKLQFNTINYPEFSSSDTWEKKLKKIFDYLDASLYIKNNNICIKENIEPAFDILNPNNKPELKIKNSLITDICDLSQHYMGVSSDDGLLKVYDACKYKEEPINVIKEFEPNKGIYSLYKSYKLSDLNKNKSIIYLMGFETIKKILFDEQFVSYQVLDEYTINDCFYINMIELQNIKGILITTLEKNILSLDKDKNNQITKYDLTNAISDQLESKEILCIDDVNSNTFIITLIDEEGQIEITEKQLIRKKTMGKNLRKSFIENNVNISNKKNIYNFIIGVEQNESNGEIEIKKKFELVKNNDILGKIGENKLIIINRNVDYKVAILNLFDVKNCQFTKRINIYNMKPVYFKKFCDYKSKEYYFILMDSKMKMIQYLFEENNLNIKALFGIDLSEVIVKKNDSENIMVFNVGGEIFLFKNDGVLYHINN